MTYAEDVAVWFSSTGVHRMVWYVAVVAVLNLGLGYALALYMGSGRAKQAPNSDEVLKLEVALPDERVPVSTAAI